MKKISKTAMSVIVATVLCLGVSENSGAQVMRKGSMNLFFGYGAPNIARSYVKGLETPTTTEIVASGRGPFTFTGQYAASNKLAVGVQFGYQSGLSAPLSWEQPNNVGGTDTRRYTMHMRIYTFMAKADFHYTKGRFLDVYSGASVGYGIAHVQYNGTEDPEAIKDFGSLKGLAYSINAIGFRVMLPQHVGAFAEFGYGVLGFATVGISVKTGG